jgi:capsid portal protein
MMEQGKIVEMQKNASAKSNQQVRALVIGGVSEDPVAKAVGAEPGKSKELPTDPFQELSAKGNLIEPPFDMLTLAMLPEQSSELNQCVEAMETNIEGFGHRFVPRLDIEQALKDPKVKPILKEVDAEKIRLENFFAYASIDDSMTDLRMKLRKDLETTGNGYLEMIRNAAGDVQGFNHIPSYQMRLAPRDHEQIKIDLPILEKQADGSIKATKLTTWKRFRRFAQSRAVLRVNLSFIGSFKLRWFKEFGDPRVIDNRTGKIGDDSLPEQHRANEIVHFKIYSARSPYGLPRFIGNLLTIFGDRASEEINFVTFRNNNIPSMVVLVSNGQLTDGSIDRIKGFVEAQIQGSDNYSKFLILEGEGDLEGEDGGQIKMEIKPLDYTRTTAEASRKLADEQIFAPARTSFDEWINRILFPQMNVVYHKFKSNTPNTTDNTELVKMLAGAEKTGGMRASAVLPGYQPRRSVLAHNGGSRQKQGGRRRTGATSHGVEGNRNAHGRDRHFRRRERRSSRRPFASSEQGARSPLATSN